MFRLALFATTLAFAAMMPGVARADAFGDLESMRLAFNAAKSWHAVEQLPDGRKVTVDYVAPYHWRIVNPAMTEVVTGDNVYMVRQGRTTPMPMLGGVIRKMLDGFRFQAYDQDVRTSARDLGMRMLHGKRLHAYSYTTRGTPVTVYVGAKHLPVQSSVQMKGGEMTITYSDWNRPISISP